MIYTHTVKSTRKKEAKSRLDFKMYTGNHTVKVIASDIGVCLSTLTKGCIERLPLAKFDLLS